MSSPSSLRGLWLRWRALRLPWRRKWIAGQDLSGTIFWEHRFNPLSSTRPRRTAEYPYNIHPGDVNLAPAWLQWLRHTRGSAPTIVEQQLEMQRQSSLKQLVAAADKRWAEQKSYLDKPSEVAQSPAEIIEPRQDSEQSLMNSMKTENDGSSSKDLQNTDKNTIIDESDRYSRAQSRQETKKEDQSKPWKRQRGAPSEEWQPQAWTPPTVNR